jgi:hypothetical protein
MPAKMFMNVQNPNNQIMRETAAPKTRAVNVAALKTRIPISLKTPMVDRIFSAKPGCGGCGK